jgi:hypothetical protein
MTDAEPERVGYTSYLARFMRELAARPVAVGFSVICVILFVLHARGMKMDGYGITLLALAVLPWSVQTFGKVADAVGQALVSANIKSFQIAGVKVEQLEKKLDQQRSMLDDLILYSMAFHIYDKLKHFALGSLNPVGPFREYKYQRNEAFDHDLRYLRDHGYLEHFQIGDLTQDENLVGRLKVTEMGQRFVKLKEDRGVGIGPPLGKS